MDPDFEKLRELCAEAEKAKDAGELTRESFGDIWDRAALAVNGRDEYLEALVQYAEPEWLQADE